MTRMIDRMLSQGVRLPAWRETNEEAVRRILSQCLPVATVIAIDNVARYYFDDLQGRHQHGWYISDFPNLAPPFRVYFMEFRFPEQLAFPNLTAYGAGVLFVAHEIEPGARLEIPRGIVESQVSKLPRLREESWEDSIRVGRDEGLRWEVEAFLFTEPTKGEVIGPCLGQAWLIDETGRNFLPGNRSVGCLFAKAILEAGPDEWYFLQTIALYPCLLATSLLHCKNVVIRDEKAPRSERRRAEREGGSAPVRFKTLNIRPMQEILRREGKSETAGLKQALHICRGHFKDYREHGLFGKESHKAIYWWDQQVRGSAAEGVIAKDYNVKKPVGA